MVGTPEGSQSLGLKAGEAINLVPSLDIDEKPCDFGIYKIEVKRNRKWLGLYSFAKYTYTVISSSLVKIFGTTSL